MRVRTQSGNLGKPVEVSQVRSAVICDDFGSPLIIAQTLGKDGVVVIYTHKDPEFRRVAKTLGIGLNTKYQEFAHAL